MFVGAVIVSPSVNVPFTFERTITSCFATPPEPEKESYPLPSTVAGCVPASPIAEVAAWNNLNVVAVGSLQVQVALMSVIPETPEIVICCPSLKA